MHSSDSEGNSDLYKDLTENRNSKEIFNDSYESLSDFEQGKKNMNEERYNNIIRKYDVFGNKNSENSSNSLTTVKYNPNNNIPCQKENSIIKKVEPIFDTHDFNEKNNSDFKDDYLNSFLIQDKDENNRENTSKEKLNNNILLNTNDSTYLEEKKEDKKEKKQKEKKQEEKKEENKMEIEEDISNDDSVRKGSETRKKDKSKKNGKNANIKFRKKKNDNSKKNPRGKSEEKDEEDKN